MDRFLISKERCLYLLQRINNGQSPGVYNWLLENHTISLFIDANGVGYYYEGLSTDRFLTSYLSSDTRVLGIYEEPEPLEEVTMNDVFGGGSDAYDY